jgi:hypothetical protein
MVAPLLITGALAIAERFLPGMVKHIAGDKAGEVAETVINAAQNITGTNNPDAALEALNADPEKVLQFKQGMAAINADLDKAYLADRQDARARDVKLKQAGYANRRADAMLVMAFISFIVIVYFAWDGRLDMPDQVFALLNMAAGMILGMIKDAFQFEFGSSRGSKEKDILKK